MDLPFDVSRYPDTFLLSDAKGFGAMIREMNVTYPIENEADYLMDPASRTSALFSWVQHRYKARRKGAS